jgi:hypothetical protein
MLRSRRDFDALRSGRSKKRALAFHENVGFIDVLNIYSKNGKNDASSKWERE